MGLISVSVDGKPAGNVSLWSPGNVSSSVVWSWRQRGARRSPCETHSVTVQWRPPRRDATPHAGARQRAAAQGRQIALDALEHPTCPVPSTSSSRPTPLGTIDDAVVTLSNVVPRRDTNGSIVNSHDGAVVQDAESGLFYLYGVSFPESCTSAFYNNCVSGGSCMGPLVRPCAYKSHDLVTWTLASPDLLPGHDDFGDQARVLRNPRTGRYVFIYRGKIGRVTSLRLAVGDGPVGPFEELEPLDTGGDVVGSQAGWHVDATGRGYAWYNTNGPPGTLFPAKQCIVELTPDFLNVTGRKSCWVPPDGFGLEGGALWSDSRPNGTFYWAAGSPCCNCALGGSARVYTARDPMGEWTFLTNMNPPLQQRPPRPPPALLKPGSSPPSHDTCEQDLEGEWVGSVYLASGGQPLRGGLRVTRVGPGLYNFTQSEPHDRAIVGVGRVAKGPNRTVTITIRLGAGVVQGVADAWPGLNSPGCTRIIWGGGATTWGKSPLVPETRFHVSSQMFGVSTLTTANGTVHMYTGERYQTAPDGVFGHGFMYWQPVAYDSAGFPQTLNWTVSFQLSL